ncbi:uncharacterized protein [Pocillopora verrucosa]|uniref:uncharacterized protein n=1 Tax=Pocillopora verrucosa TaxID=203993 RepID=UPI002797AFDB|nr:uncharacterized protein LOC131794688 [Pocillopora verrucosa]
MLSSKHHFFRINFILPLALCLGSRYCGLSDAKETQVMSTAAAIKTSLTMEIKPSMRMAGFRENYATKTLAASLEIKTIYSKSKVFTAQETNIPEQSSFSAEAVFRQSRATKRSSTFLYSDALTSTSRVNSGSTHANTSTYFFPELPSSVVSFSPNRTNHFELNSTAAPTHNYDENGDCSSGQTVEKSCDTYVTRWVDFYVNIGGWIMLAVVLVGITVLVSTHFQARKKTKELKRLPQLMYKEIRRNRGRWM